MLVWTLAFDPLFTELVLPHYNDFNVFSTYKMDCAFIAWRAPLCTRLLQLSAWPVCFALGNCKIWSYSCNNNSADFELCYHFFHRSDSTLATEIPKLQTWTWVFPVSMAFGTPTGSSTASRAYCLGEQFYHFTKVKNYLKSHGFRYFWIALFFLGTKSWYNQLTPIVYPSANSHLESNPGSAKGAGGWVGLAWNPSQSRNQLIIVYHTMCPSLPSQLSSLVVPLLFPCGM